MKRITLLIASIALIGTAAIGQRTPLIGNSTQLAAPPTRTCGTMDNVSAEDIANFEAAIAPHVANYLQNHANGNTPEVIYNIPTVVHVIHNTTEGVGTGRNIPNARIQEQIQILNDDYRRTNADAVNTPSGFVGVAADCEINFCLIQTYPSGHPNAGQTMPEPGVDRVSTASISGISNTTSGYSMTTIDNTIKPATSWNPNEVMNIWVCQLQSGLLGYATFPNSGPANEDGTVMGYQYFGLTGGPYGLGRTTTHEVGHWLGLYHIWGDDGGACSGSDQVSDTPNQAGSTGGCPSGTQTDACSPSAPGYMYQNYMDYSNDACMNLFTAGQKARMQSVMSTEPRRSTLSGFSSTLCAATPLTAQFNASVTTINAGQSVTFTDASTGPDPITNWSWDFDVTGIGGVTPGTASTQGPHVVTYNTPGTFTVSLQVTDNVAATDTETKNAYIIVNPAGTVTCDSTAANWDWVSEAFGSAYWGAESPPICAGSNSGAIMGNNCYDDNGWASKVSFSASGKELTEVIYVFVTSSGTGVASLKVWDDDGAGNIPGTVLFSQATTTGAYSGSLNQFVSVPVSPAVPLTGDFYIGNDHAVTPIDGDSLVMGVANGTTGNQTWANETGGWVDLSTYGVDYKGTVIAVICDISTGENEIVGEINKVTVFPNPSTGELNVLLTNKVMTNITVYNVVGKEVYHVTNNGNQKLTIDLNDQPNGIYFVNVKTGDTVVTKKIVLSK